MTNQQQTKYFTSYSGVSLPLNLVNEITDDVTRRITYFTAYYDDKNKLQRIEKVVYGEIEFTHEYSYDENGKITQAIIIEQDEESRTLVFDETGQASEI